MTTTARTVILTVANARSGDRLHAIVGKTPDGYREYAVSGTIETIERVGGCLDSWGAVDLGWFSVKVGGETHTMRGDAYAYTLPA